MPVVDAWQRFREAIAERNRMLGAEAARAWLDLDALLTTIGDAYEGAETLNGGGDLKSLADGFAQTALVLLEEPAAALRLHKPDTRFIRALEDWAAQASDLVRMLPADAPVSSRDLAALIGGDASRWLRWSKGKGAAVRPLRMREILQSALTRRLNARSRLDGELALGLARAVALAIQPWHAVEQRLLRGVAGTTSDDAAWIAGRRQWRKEVAALRAWMQVRAQRFEAWLAGEPAALGRALLARKRPLRPERLESLTQRYERRFAFWSRQLRAVASVLDSDLDVHRLAAGVFQEARSAVESVSEEREAVVAELDAVIAWLEAWRGGQRGAAFPPASARLISSDDHLAVWQRELAAHARDRLAESRETVEPKHAQPGRRRQWKIVQPRQLFLQACGGASRRAAAQAFRETEALHRAIIREIERSREVVRFAMETAAQDPEAGERIADEGTANALSLVREQRLQSPDTPALTDRALARSAALALLQYQISVDKGRLGLWTHLARESGQNAFGRGLRLLLQGTRIAAGWTWEHTRSSYQFLLARIGWLPGATRAPKPVERSARLDSVMAIESAAPDLPMLYQRLFRIAPVEDPRFLIGRDAEMAALAEARDLWMRGKSAPVILLGARGSGKTSLLNCAESLVFSGVPVVRTHFGERLYRPEEIDAFLAGACGLPQGLPVADELNREPRVIIVEETERAYLRTMDGFDGLAYLADLIQATGRRVLWILSVNQHAFALLNRALRFGDAFLYRINAVHVAREQLRNAILVRHNLSGMRLSFLPPPAGDPRFEQARQWLGLQGDAQDMFFDALYGQSEGVFRSALQLWQKYIDRVEGGVLSMRFPLEPDFEPILREIHDGDAFVLHAILEHGSLTAPELAAALEMRESAAESALERLLARELLEPEPAAAGLRVRPEAGRIVTEALHRRNLV